MGPRWEGASSDGKDEAEKRVLWAAFDSFRQYRRAAHYNTTHRRRQNFYALPEKEWKMLAEPPFEVLGHLDKVDDAIDANAELATAILHSGLAAFGIAERNQDAAPEWEGQATPSDMEKANTTIRQYFRDWSEEGAVERKACYDPVLQDLCKIFPSEARNTTKVLLPGAGLGRLVFEVCRLGFSAEGNEISFHQLIGSNWVLNEVQRDQKFQLYPFALNFSNNLSRANQLRCVSIPDMHPGTALANASDGASIHAFERMAMTAADFVVLYSSEQYQQTFDALVTVFFLDTAPNVLRYIDTIHHTLRPGGYWINLGPLLWHFENHAPSTSPSEDTPSIPEPNLGIGEPGNVELALEEVLLLIERKGFTFQHQEILHSGVGYIQDLLSMSTSHYTVSHFIARRGA